MHNFIIPDVIESLAIAAIIFTTIPQWIMLGVSLFRLLTLDPSDHYKYQHYKAGECAQSKLQLLTLFIPGTFLVYAIYASTKYLISIMKLKQFYTNFKKLPLIKK